jgi:hypothetical protein
MNDQYEVEEWVAPPEPTPPVTAKTGKWAIMGEECANRPGQWAKAKTGLWNPNIPAIAKSLKNSHPEWEYEIRIIPHYDDRNFRQKSDVYIRCVGAAE